MTREIQSKVFLATELSAFLVFLPLLVVSVQAYGFRRFLLLAGGLFALWRMIGKISLSALFSRPRQGWWRAPLLRGTLFFLLAVLYVLFTEPENLFRLPREKPLLWTAIVILYPWFSVLPQELIYRVYLFEVMRPLWKPLWLAVPASALLFGWVHIIYAGWFAVALSGIGGVILGWSYLRMREHNGAIWPLILEHSLYGLILFTVGLGRHFFLSR